MASTNSVELLWTMLRDHPLSEIIAPSRRRA